MNVEPTWYWLVFLAAVILWALVPLAAWWEHRRDRQDQETWQRIRDGRKP